MSLDPRVRIRSVDNFDSGAADDILARSVTRVRTSIERVRERLPVSRHVRLSGTENRYKEACC